MKAKTIFILSLLFSAISCTTYKGVVLDSKCSGDCSYQGIATGSAEVSYFLGMGGNSSESLLFEAKRNMYLAFPLGKGEFFDDIIVDYKTSHYLVYSKLKVVVTADIVKKGSFAEDLVYTDNYEHLLAAGKTTIVDHLTLSDSVIFIKGSEVKKGILVGFVKNDARVLVCNSREYIEEVSVPIKRLFSIDNEEIEDLTGLEANQIIEFSSAGKNKEAIVKEVIGLRPENVLLKITRNGIDTYSVVPVKSLKYK